MKLTLVPRKIDGQFVDMVEIRKDAYPWALTHVDLFHQGDKVLDDALYRRLLDGQTVTVEVTVAAIDIA